MSTQRMTQENDPFPWTKITLKEALSLDETTLTHCLYAFHDPTDWLYIGLSHRLVTRLYQHLGIATANGEKWLDPEQAIELLSSKSEELTDYQDYYSHLDIDHYYWDIYACVPIKDLGLFIMNNRPKSLEWGYYYAPLQRLYPEASGTELNRLLYVEEKKLIQQHRPVFNKRNKPP
ncbi:hypothetical protein C5B42_02275 [Candidatus Cerribacteria bacterium 'Amazon FNV 2010 28 9']|uniref:GIY-YIG domain-containing protein n=1 Tax=Candidatus Cerribacteria bacterium 'Amazon FNV 2010 28 9' TaxID=2081795 RepID=A0A317JU91_9BACT|nr:MAG: hypothetical protein C5B42_02275 [Candidatus Cerribacteria bacterium 'Amazon FNV 2010 28 9']